ncbi:MAG: cobalt/nickel transport system permease protein [Candidatus Saganbacteria bacterium]|uniref:Cobalt/nickel transport system permease protein n=1 Tax=Candidatus Saganbacteria bacterium TaxID=2575572 RepID=A0A833KZZ1_UNCSA|nr:MAG: cobalt/nickel transport system permease protein [Candidatus Saganbacteria bacterium]
MHIPDGFLDPKISAGMMGAAAMALGYCFSKLKAAVTAVVSQHALAVAGKGVQSIASGGRRVLTKLGEQKIYQMGMTASLIFAAQMFNFPISSGTSGHLIGGVFASVILGPFAGAIVIASVLLVQSFFFADGGLLALGANIINMAVLGSLVCYYIYYYLKKIAPEVVAIMAAAWTSVVLAALACSLQIGFSGTIALSEIIPAMMRVHMVIGIAEALITLALVNVFRSMLKEE